MQDQLTPKEIILLIMIGILMIFGAVMLYQGQDTQSKCEGMGGTALFSNSSYVGCKLPSPTISPSK